MQIYGHRGARSYAPENTLPGYKTALKIGVDYVDMDIGITKDGVIVVTHDMWLNPDIVSENSKFWANGKEEFIKSMQQDKFNQQIEPYLIKNLTFDHLQQYEVGVINPKSPYSKFFPDQVSMPGTHIPSLQMVIDYVNKVSNKQVNFNIEIKNDPLHPDWTVSPKEFADKIYKLLKQNNIIDKAEVQSFDWRPLYELQQLDPKIKTGYLVGADDIKRMQDIDTKKAGLYSGGKLLRDYHNSLPQMVKALGGSCYEPEDIGLTKADLDEAHKLGLKVVVWTWPENSGGVFNSKLINQLIDWGIDSITTDDPGRLASIFAARGCRVPKRYEIR
ncbi:MAG: glycerophosphodiester phosphodiesterase [Burkholderiales bacterium]|jgi:glycerophosphoryl diester phosphodiesterase|nr:glycerophosphodiester phosphodiesterase [Burkholderiales bacterium]